MRGVAVGWWVGVGVVIAVYLYMNTYLYILVGTVEVGVEVVMPVREPRQVVGVEVDWVAEGARSWSRARQARLFLRGSC